MATVRKRGTSWQAQVRRSGQPTLTRSFKRKPDALEWARQLEAEIDRRGLIPDRSILEKMTVGDLLRRYRDDVVEHKRCRDRERLFIEVLLRHDMCGYALSHASPDLFRRYRDERLRSVKSSSVRRELGILQHAFSTAIREWALPLPDNPLAMISKPKLGPHRERRLARSEWDKLMDGCGKSRVWWLSPVIRLALETGMRRGELVAMRWSDIDLENRTLHIPMTKNGHARTIPLTPAAVEVLKELPRSGDDVFPVSGNAVRLAWQRLKKRVDVEDLRFHDLRHEAISRFFEMGLSMPEVALISGHRDPRMLFRYTHMNARSVAQRLGHIGDSW